MKCTNCGEVFDYKFRFCPGCGTSVSSISGVSGVEAGDVSLGGMKTVVGEEVQGPGFKVQGSDLFLRGVCVWVSANYDKDNAVPSVFGKCGCLEKRGLPWEMKSGLFMTMKGGCSDG